MTVGRTTVCALGMRWRIVLKQSITVSSSFAKSKRTFVSTAISIGFDMPGIAVDERHTTVKELFPLPVRIRIRLSAFLLGNLSANRLRFRRLFHSGYTFCSGLCKYTPHCGQSFCAQSKADGETLQVMPRCAASGRSAYFTNVRPAGKQALRDSLNFSRARIAGE
jgi:hypothetical protein